MGDIIFEVDDKKGRKVRLTKERWGHITSPSSLHPYMTNYLEEMKEAIINPDVEVPQKFDETKVNYYKYIKRIERHILVVVKYINNEGDVRTAHKTRKIIRR
jgi:hypothetical protein